MKRKTLLEKAIIGIATVAVAATLIPSVVAAKGKRPELSRGFYPETGIVTEIEKVKNSDEYLLTVTVGNGNMFSFYDENGDWFLGDLCSMIMYDNGTEIVLDDEVVDVRYAGFLELFEEYEFPEEWE